MPSRVSIAELIDADISLRPEDAVAIVSEVCRQFEDGALHGIPNPTVIRLTPDGGVAVEGPVSRDQAAVPAAATLLSDLLPPFEQATGFKVPGGLRLVLARATGTLDLPPFADTSAFRAAIERFSAPDLQSSVRGLFEAWAHRRDPAAPRELTISDVRRARRATGLTLEDVSRAAGVPAVKLRELEWGYLRNWGTDAESRAALGRYARAAGLDEDLVVSIAWPLIERADVDGEAAAAGTAGDQAGWGLVPVGPQDLQPSSQPSAAPPRPHPLLRHRWALALAAAILIAVAGVVTGWDRSSPLPAAAPAFAQRSD